MKAPKILRVKTKAGMVTVRATEYGVELSVEGYGVSSQDGGAFIYLDMDAAEIAKPGLLVWADINQEDPTHVIDFSGALNSNYKQKQEEGAK
jgi:hypothetical protein